MSCVNVSCGRGFCSSTCILSHRGNETADLVFGATAARAFQRHARCGRVEQLPTALHRPLQRVDHRMGPRIGADLHADRYAEHIARPTEVDDLGLGRQRIGNHRHAALTGLQTRGTPVDISDAAFGAVDGNPVIELIGLGGVEDDAGMFDSPQRPRFRRG